MTARLTPDERAAMRARHTASRGAVQRGVAALTDVPRLLDALDTAEAEVARLREDTARPAPAQSDDLGQSYCPVHGDLLAGECSWRCANAAPGHERLAPPPVWDEDTVREAVAQAILARYSSFDPLSAYGIADAVVAVVREHLPVRPDRETLIEAMSAALHITTDRIPGLNPGPALSADTASVVVAADAVLAEWPGESRATVQAEALRDAADAVTEIDGRRDDAAARWLRARADRLEGGTTP